MRIASIPEKSTTPRSGTPNSGSQSMKNLPCIVDSRISPSNSGFSLEMAKEGKLVHGA